MPKLPNIKTNGQLPDGSVFWSEGTSSSFNVKLKDEKFGSEFVYSPSSKDFYIPIKSDFNSSLSTIDGQKMVSNFQTGVSIAAALTGPFLGPFGMIACKFLSHFDKIDLR